MRRAHLIATTVAAVTALSGRRLRRRVMVVSIIGDSMSPTFGSGDRVLVVRSRPQRLRVGDVIVLAPNATAPRPLPGGLVVESGAEAGWLIKRVAAMPGDRVPGPVTSRVPGALVGPGRLVVLGDNPRVSYDSRHAGAITFDQVVGRVARRLPTAPAVLGRQVQPAPIRPVDRPAHNKGDQR